MDNHAPAVDVTDLQRRHLRPAAAGAVECHQHGALKGCPGGIDQPRDLFLAEYLRQVQNLLRIRRLGDAPASLQNLRIEETQSCQPLRYGIRGQLPPGEKSSLILADVLRAKLIGRTMEVSTEVFNGADVSADGGLGVVTALQFLEHDLA